MWRPPATQAGTVADWSVSPQSNLNLPVCPRWQARKAEATVAHRDRDTVTVTVTRTGVSLSSTDILYTYNGRLLAGCQWRTRPLPPL